jgi:Zn-dependent protease
MLNLGFRRFRLGEIFRIPVYLDWSTIFLALMFLQSGSVLFALGLTIILLASIIFHELAHSLTARCFGYETRDITLTVIGGCASLERMPSKAWQEFLTAAAGPASSIVFGIVLCILASFTPRGNMLGDVLYCGGLINYGLALFNLLPGFPMDGGRIFRSALRLFFTRAKATYVAMLVGRIAAVTLVAGPLLGITHIWIIPLGGSIILRALIAFMIWREGYREYLSALDEERFTRWTQGDFNARVSPPPYDD